MKLYLALYCTEEPCIGGCFSVEAFCFTTEDIRNKFVQDWIKEHESFEMVDELTYRSNGWRYYLILKEQETDTTYWKNFVLKKY